MTIPELRAKLTECLRRAEQGRMVMGTQIWAELWEDPAIWRLLLAALERAESESGEVRP